ncbi:MAG: right-handed parallel beta-helix repeat-containing protein [Ruminococcus sp.]|nr:right-handed parallel beta-helix repeat-containing protein [Ruminococcus sp.]
MKIYVDANAGRDGNGSEEMPFKRINDAARIAQAGDEVIVMPGVYREYVDPKNAGTSDKRIVYRSAEPLGAEITGAELLTGWTKYNDKVWTASVDSSIFGAYDPYTTFVYGDWYFAGKTKHTGAVYLNDKALYEADSIDACTSGEKSVYSWCPEDSVYKWYAEEKDGRTIFYCNFGDKDPNNEKIEINVRRRCFMPSKMGVGYITVSGFRISKAATTWAPPAAFQDGMIGPHWSKGWIIEDCDISNSKCAGISVGKYYDPKNDHYFTTKHVKSPTQMERDAVCRGQFHGWLKEKVGSHIIRRNNIHHCEQGGIIGRMGGVFSIIEDNHIHHINNMMELGGAEIAGIKMHAAIDVTMRRNHIHHCTMGIWCDWEAQGTRITQNLLHDNQSPDFAQHLPGGMMSQDIFVEVSHGPTIIDNNILLSDVSLRMPSEGLAVIHNLICGSFTSIDDGCDGLVDGKLRQRFTPYHIPHRTEVMGFMTLLHGDDRFYNNIFVQKYDTVPHNGTTDNAEVGTHLFDDFPTYDEWIANFDMDSDTPDMSGLEKYHWSYLPVWCDGNVYLSGSKSWKNEKNKFMSSESVNIELEEKNGRICLKTDLYKLIDKFSAGMISTGMLGEAFEPEQKFEAPDGRDIVFDSDYLGNHRGSAVIPGPFAEAAENYELYR